MVPPRRRVPQPHSGAAAPSAPGFWAQMKLRLHIRVSDPQLEVLRVCFRKRFSALRIVISSYRLNYVSDQIPGAARPRSSDEAAGPGAAAETLTPQGILMG